jgi:hypothetical protein
MQQMVSQLIKCYLPQSQCDRSHCSIKILNIFFCGDARIFLDRARPPQILIINILKLNMNLPFLCLKIAPKIWQSHTVGTRELANVFDKSVIYEPTLVKKYFSLNAFKELQILLSSGLRYKNMMIINDHHE